MHWLHALFGWPRRHGAADYPAHQSGCGGQVTAAATLGPGSGAWLAHLALLSTHGNSYDRDYFGDSSGLPDAVLKQQKFKNGTEWDMPMLNVFHRRGKVIRHFWGSELLYVPAEPGQEYRHNDALDALWSMLDLTPAGRGDFHPQLSYPPVNSK